MKIIRQIITGETDPETRAENRHYNCRKSKEEMAKALVSNDREDFLYCLKNEVKLNDYMSDEIKYVDLRIAKQIENYIHSMPEVVDDLPSIQK